MVASVGWRAGGRPTRPAPPADCDCREGTATGQNRAPAKEIAVRLAVEGRTVERHTARAVEKLWPKIRVDVARYAAGQGWLAGK
ncbi:MAG TPA: hypothetical protein VKE74_17315 [Gemmataceae bacterium]|nr:hypothetical protein [Gemmataceae bacterium]